MRKFKQKSSDSTEVTSTISHSHDGENPDYTCAIEDRPGKPERRFPELPEFPILPCSNDQPEVTEYTKMPNDVRKRFSAFSETEENIIKKAFKECWGLDTEKHNKGSLARNFNTKVMGIGHMYLCIDDETADPSLDERHDTHIQILTHRMNVFQMVLTMLSKDHEQCISPDELNLLKEEAASAREALEISLTNRRCISAAEIKIPVKLPNYEREPL